MLTIAIPAKRDWVDTGLPVDAGHILDCFATGIWVDGLIPCTANGYSARLFYALKWRPCIADCGRYFRLMGRIIAYGAAPTTDDPGATFVIGSGRSMTASMQGRLSVFANHRSGYGNNRGTVRLAVSTRRASSSDAKHSPSQHPTA